MAAQYSRHAASPLHFMARVLEAWQQKGISTIAQAQKEQEARRDYAPKQAAQEKLPSREVGAHRYSQRQYTDEELDRIYSDLNQLTLEGDEQ